MSTDVLSQPFFDQKDPLALKKLVDALAVKIFSTYPKFQVKKLFQLNFWTLRLRLLLLIFKKILNLFVIL